MGSLSLSPPGKFLLNGVTFRFQVFWDLLRIPFFSEEITPISPFWEGLGFNKGMPKETVEIEPEIAQVDE